LFYEKRALKKYGIDTSLIESRLPYFEISERKFKKSDDKKITSDRRERTPTVSIKLDLNLADSIQLQRLQGRSYFGTLRLQIPTSTRQFL